MLKTNYSSGKNKFSGNCFYLSSEKYEITLMNCNYLLGTCLLWTCLDIWLNEKGSTVPCTERKCGRCKWPTPLCPAWWPGSSHRSLFLVMASTGHTLPGRERERAHSEEWSAANIHYKARERLVGSHWLTRREHREVRSKALSIV